MDTRACAQCGTSFPARQQRGQPRMYCSLACRRVMELRRRAWDEQMTLLQEARVHRGPLGHWSMLTPSQAEAAIVRMLREMPRP